MRDSDREIIPPIRVENLEDLQQYHLFDQNGLFWILAHWEGDGNELAREINEDLEAGKRIILKGPQIVTVTPRRKRRKQAGKTHE